MVRNQVKAAKLSSAHFEGLCSELTGWLGYEAPSSSLLPCYLQWLLPDRQGTQMFLQESERESTAGRRKRMSHYLVQTQGYAPEAAPGFRSPAELSKGHRSPIQTSALLLAFAKHVPRNALLFYHICNSQATAPLWGEHPTCTCS